MNHEKIHESLITSMQKEIAVMRELLSNMHQEEATLLTHDKKSWEKLMIDRSVMIALLGKLRRERIQAMNELKNAAAIEHPKKLKQEDLLPPNDSSSGEILSLSEQIMALVEKMNAQMSRNERLFNEKEHPHHPFETRQPQPLPQKKRKSSIATYPTKD